MTTSSSPIPLIFDGEANPHFGIEPGIIVHLLERMKKHTLTQLPIQVMENQVQ